MCRFALAFVLLAASVPASVGQEAGLQRLPRLSLVLPSGFASETVQINYFMGGSFGGYGGYVRAGKKPHNLRDRRLRRWKTSDEHQAHCIFARMQDCNSQHPAARRDTGKTASV